MSKQKIDAKCKAKAKTQPHFTVVASDNFAQDIVQTWIDLAEAYNVPAAKIKAAKQTLDEIKYWRTMHPIACKIAD